MGANTDDGFLIESHEGQADGGAVLRFIALAESEEEALSLLQRDFPALRHEVVDSGLELRAQAAGLGLAPGTYQRA
jgi:hypothetical protein